MPRITVSIVHHANPELLAACLHSLYNSDQGIEFETIVVDNVSADGSVETTRSLYPRVRQILNTERKGFGANHNQAIEASLTEYVFVLNDDTIVPPGTLRTLVDFLDARPDAGVAGSRLDNSDGSLQRSCYRFPSPARCLAENLMLVAAFPNSRLFGDYRSWPHDTVRTVDFLSGAAILVRRKAIEQCGGFDESFFMYAEEADWQFRMHRKGWAVAFTPEARVVHYGGQSTGGIKDRQFCEFYRSQMRFFRKHYGLTGELVSRGANVLGAAIRIPMFSLAAVARPGKRVTLHNTVALWKRILKWHLGFGPHEGIRELTAQSRAAAVAAPGSSA